jgi:hypothetical protein
MPDFGAARRKGYGSLAFAFGLRRTLSWLCALFFCSWQTVLCPATRTFLEEAARIQPVLEGTERNLGFQCVGDLADPGASGMETYSVL